MTTADTLLVIDVQRGFVSGEHAVPDADRLVDEVAALIERARTLGALIVHLRNDGPAGEPDEPGTPSWELQLVPADGEPLIGKQSDDAFVDTDLGAVLDRRGSRRVVVCGLLSEMCVAATARSAAALGYEVVVPHRAHGTYDVPPGPGGGPGVPAALAARAAEWSLGDDVEVVGGAADVDFVGVP